jgi:cytochrome P450
MLCYHSGNRDETAFERPFEFDIRRGQNKHVAFGHGPHVCLGQHLGRMEMRIFWEELLPRLESVELAGKPANSNAVFVSGPKHVPIRYRMN